MAAPALPDPPKEYAQSYMLGLLNVLRLYFTGQVDVRDPVVFSLAGVAAYTTATVDLGTKSGEVVLVDTTANPVTVNLPLPNTSMDYRFTVKLAVKPGANAVTVKSASGTIDGTAGGTGVTISTLYASKTFKSDGTNYWIIGSV